MAVAARRRPPDGIHVVAPGDTISSVAAQYGITEWEERVYNAPENSQLKLARPNPNTLVPGDEIFIPELAKKTEARPTDAWHDFHITGNKRFLRLKLQNADDTAVADEPYRIEPKSSFRGRFVQQGQATSPEGVIEEQIPHTMSEAELILTNLNMVIRLKIGHLLPLPMQEAVKNTAADVLGDAVGGALGELGGIGDAAGALGGALGGSGSASGSLSIGSGGASLGGGASALAAGGAQAQAALGKAASVAAAAAGAVAGALGDLSLGNEEDPNIYSAAQRLRSMGFQPGEPRDNHRTPAFTGALMAFQTWCKEQGNLADSAGGPLGSLTSPGGVLGGGGGPLGDIAAGVAGPMLAAVGLTGQLDEPTIDALKTTHGC